MLCRTAGGGDIAFLTGHAPMIGALDTWSVKVTTVDEGEQWFAVHGGFVEVSGDSVIVLSDVAEAAEDIDVDRARAARDRAESELRTDPDNEETKAALLAPTSASTSPPSRGRSLSNFVLASDFPDIRRIYARMRGGMATWGDLEAAAPDLAAFGAELLLGPPAYLATVRDDGVPACTR